MKSPGDSTAMTGEQYSMSHPQGVGRGYWHMARNRILLREIKQYLHENATVLDVGCGPGIIVDFLRKSEVQCFGVDVGTPRPDVPEVAPYLFLGESAFDLAPAFRESVSVILLMDVLEHLPEPVEFLRQCRIAFPSTSVFLITLPARPEIWSNYDEFYGHYRRYTLPMIAELAEFSGLELRRERYFFHSLYFAARVLKLLSVARSTRVVAPRFPVVHKLLGRAFSLEARALPRWMPGSSALAHFVQR